MLESRLLLSGMAAAEVPVVDAGGESSAAADEQMAGNGGASVPAATAAARPGGAQQRYVAVIVFIDGLGHADIALTDADGTTVYGQHQAGNGNNPGLQGTAFRRRTLDTYIENEALAGGRVYISQVPVDQQTFDAIEAHLLHEWNTDIHFNLLLDNCAQNVGFVLKEHDLLDAWPGGTNSVDDWDFLFPEGDLYDDWISGDEGWEHRPAGYLSTTPGDSLFDSFESTPPPGTGVPGGTTGSDSGDGNSSQQDAPGEATPGTRDREEPWLHSLLNDILDELLM